MTTDEILGQITDLPSLPEVYYRVRDVLSQPESSLEQLADAIETDPAIAARLLRLANSALYQFPTKIETVHRATTIIGTKEIQELILATAVLSAFEGMPVGVVSMRSFWEHSIACGLAARTIATYRGESNIERFYVAGLLHDIGRIVLFITQPQRMSEILEQHRSRNRPLVSLERDVFGVCHGEIGGALLARWNLPKSLCETVAGHHINDPEGGQHVDVAVVHIADLIVNALRMGNSGNQLVPRLNESAWQQVGLAVSDLDEIVTQTDERLTEVAAIFIQS